MKKKGFCLSSFLLFIVFAVSACGKIPDFAGIQTQSGFTPNPDGGANAKIDILFVIDNSGTMQPDQQVLADSFGSFISAFADRNLQYHIGVISTDTCRLVTPPTFCIDQWNVTGTDPNNPTSTSQYKYGGIFNNGIGGLLTRYDVDGVFYPNGQSVVSPSDPLKFLAWDVDPDPVVAKALTISRFTNNALIGTTGSGSEAPLSTIVAAIDRNAAYNGTDNQLDVNYNNGFFRSSAFTAIFIVTDEDEGYGYAGTPTIVGAAGDYLSGSIVETSSLQLE